MVYARKSLPKLDRFWVMPLSATFEFLQLFSENWRIHRDDFHVLAFIASIRHFATSMRWH
jgi:hypothetical protein